MSIIVRLDGGLGNQLFQYAAGRSISKRLGVDLLLDDTLFAYKRAGVTPRLFELGAYDIHAKLLNAEQKNAVSNRIHRLYKYLYRFGIKKSPYAVYAENKFSYNADICNVKDDTIILGFWQSEKYFKNIRKELLEEIKPRKDLCRDIVDYKHEINSVNSVSLHVRRGDYITNANAASYHHVCDLGYYKKAIEFITKQVIDPIFFIFSDDPDWVRNEFKLTCSSVVVSRKENTPAYEDLQLMSYCKHHVIANSSFSWWGAWLDSNPDKIVIAPNKWFRADKDINDLLPKEWIVL